jgi:hypothetical protein
MKHERRFLALEMANPVRHDSGTKKADLPKKRWTVQSGTATVEPGLDLPVTDSIIFNLAPICFAFPPFLPLKPTTQNRDSVLIQIGESHSLVRVNVFHGEFLNIPIAFPLLLFATVTTFGYCSTKNCLEQLWPYGVL